MSQANIALVQSLYDAFGRGDIGFIVDAAIPDIHWEVAGRHEDYPLFGVFHGRAGVQEFFATIGQHQDLVEFAPKEFYAAADKVFVLGRDSWTVRKTGKRVATDWVHVFTVGDGKVHRFHEFCDTAQYALAYGADRKAA